MTSNGQPIDLDVLIAKGATKVEITFGGFYVVMDKRPDGDWIGWDVFDYRKRYPSKIASSLDLGTAIRYAMQARDAVKPTPTEGTDK